MKEKTFNKVKRELLKSIKQKINIAAKKDEFYEFNDAIWDMQDDVDKLVRILEAEFEQRSCEDRTFVQMRGELAINDPRRKV